MPRGSGRSPGRTVGDFLSGHGCVPRRLLRRRVGELRRVARTVRSAKQAFYPATLPECDGTMPDRPSRAEEVVAQFIGAWNAHYESEARQLLEATCNEQTHFVSAHGEHWGLSAQLASIGAFRRQYPKGRCSARLLAEHHGWILVAWTTEFGDGQPPLTGIDAGLLGASGRLTQMVSFSPLPAP